VKYLAVEVLPLVEVMILVVCLMCTVHCIYRADTE